jgi:hypothetical protein
VASVYLANVTGDGLTPETAYRPSGFDSQACAILMLDTVRGKCLVVSGNDNNAAVGVTKLVSAASFAALRTLAATTNPTAAKRTAINTWLTGAGLTPLGAGQVTWQDCVEFVGRQVNPDTSLAQTSV